MTTTDLRLALRRFNEVATADLPIEVRSAILEMATELPGEVDLGPVLVSRLLEVPAPVATLSELLDVKGFGVERLVRLVRSLAATDVTTLVGLGGDVASLRVLLGSLRPGRSRELVDLIATGRAAAVLGDDFPFLDQVVAVVNNPPMATDPDFDLDAFAGLTATVASVLPTGEFLGLLFPDEDEPPFEESEDIDDRPPVAVLDEDWPPPEEKNPGGCPPLTIAFGRVTVTPPVLGDLDGLRQILADLVDLQVSLGRLTVGGLVALQSGLRRLAPFLGPVLLDAAAELLRRFRALQGDLGPHGAPCRAASPG